MHHRHRRHRPRRRLRRPVRPAHRPAGARGARLQRDRAPHHHAPPRSPARRPPGVISQRRPEVGPRRGRAAASTPRVYDLGVPVLGICYGAQLVAQQLGGEVARTGRGEYGRTALHRHDGGRACSAVACPTEQQVWMSHFDSIIARPRRLRGHRHRRPTRRSRRSRTPTRRIYGVQFHPEVVHTPHGQAAARALPLRRVRAASPTWTMTSVIDAAGRRACGPRSATPGSSAGCPAASTRRWPPRSCTGPSAPSSRACSSTPASCARARASRSSRPSAATRASS